MDTAIVAAVIASIATIVAALISGRRMVGSRKTKNQNQAALSSSATSVSKVSEKLFLLDEKLCDRIKLKKTESLVINKEMHYFDNNVDSTGTIVILLHGLGLDQEDFRNYLKYSERRCIAPTLYGFHREDRHEALKLSLESHCRIFGEFISYIAELHKPKSILLAGFSLGADLILWSFSKYQIENTSGVKALLLLDPNLTSTTYFLTSALAKIQSNQSDDVLDVIRQIGGKAQTIHEWLRLHQYMVKVFGKFRDDVSFLKDFAAQAVDNFPNETTESFAGWYKAALDSVKLIQYVFSNDPGGESLLKELLHENMKNNILGKWYRTGMLKYEAGIDHFGLIELENLSRYIERLANEI